MTRPRAAAGDLQSVLDRALTDLICTPILLAHDGGIDQHEVERLRGLLVRSAAAHGWRLREGWDLDIELCEHGELIVLAAVPGVSGLCRDLVDAWEPCR